MEQFLTSSRPIPSAVPAPVSCKPVFQKASSHGGEISRSPSWNSLFLASCGVSWLQTSETSLWGAHNRAAGDAQSLTGAWHEGSHLSTRRGLSPHCHPRTLPARSPWWAMGRAGTRVHSKAQSLVPLQLQDALCTNRLRLRICNDCSLVPWSKCFLK